MKQPGRKGRGCHAHGNARLQFLHLDSLLGQGALAGAAHGVAFVSHQRKCPRPWPGSLGLVLAQYFARTGHLCRGCAVQHQYPVTEDGLANQGVLVRICRAVRRTTPVVAVSIK